jgi:hypothetical protein
VTKLGSEGRILTFYSFKGGVGRTMAVANVAFLAALNGLRVLVMDWDLEAPGLHYYFRGLVEGPEAGQLRRARGILDIAWEWSEGIQNAKTGPQVQALVDRFERGDPFKDCVRSIPLPAPFLNGGLDFINAGGPTISGDEEKSYEEALAQFHWPDFFSGEAGGAALESLRRWAKANYDFILIDSRTGLADVAGICTMQLPDAVALCFVLNRQNIDGVAQVAAAIRSRRNDEVRLHAVPMRVAAAGTSEEADARARATVVLGRMGGFSAEAIAEDFGLLAVRASPNVPFYETLAPLTAPDLRHDSLVLNYLGLGSHLLDYDLELPEFDPDWIELVRRRLQPRHATIDYVTKLRAADPARAILEVTGFIESAFEAILDGTDLKEDYVAVLVDVALTLVDQHEDPESGLSLINHTLDLLRALYTEAPDRWRDAFAAAIDRCLETFGFYLEAEDELALLEEFDGLHANDRSVHGRLQRLNRRRRAARIYISEHNIDAANQTIGEIHKLIKDLITARSLVEHGEEVRAAELDVHLLRGDIHQADDQPARAYQEYRAGLSRAFAPNPQPPRGETLRLIYDLHSRLARGPEDEVPPREAADSAMEAARIGSAAGGISALVTQFTDLAAAIIRNGDSRRARDYCATVLDAPDRRLRLQLANYYGRQPRFAGLFFRTMAQLVDLMGEAQPAGEPILMAVAETAEGVLRTAERRRHTYGDRQRDMMSEPLRDLIVALRRAGAPEPAWAPLRSAIGNLSGRARPGSVADEA